MQKLLFLIGFLSALSSQAQEGPAPKKFITTIPIRLVLRDYNIGYGKALDSAHTLELRVGYVHRNNLLHDHIYEPWLLSTEMLFHGISVYTQYNRWHFNKNGKRTYEGLIFGYRYLWYHDRNMWMGGIGGSGFEESLQLSQWKNDAMFLVTKGWQTSKVTTFEISIGFRLMYTHTNVTNTKFHFDPYGSEEYEEYKRNAANEILFSEGFGILPVFRLSSRLGKFVW